MSPLEINMEVQELEADGQKCLNCDVLIRGVMFQYFLFEGGSLDPVPTKYIYCQSCYNGLDSDSK